MAVNSSFERLFNSRLAVSSGIAVLILAVFLIASSFTKRSDKEIRSKEVNLIIRQIGHQLLLQSGDSTSRVLPVTENQEGIFRLEFENELVFSHDSLLALAESLLPKSQFPHGYTLTVHDCMAARIVYGFQINKNAHIQPCKGRIEPPGCYSLEVSFLKLYEETLDYPLVSVVCSGMLAIVGIVSLMRRSTKSLIPSSSKDQSHPILKTSASELPTLGKFSFDVKNQRLLLHAEVISLTEKECRILELLNQNFGELIPRETLIQKIWIDEGVVTGRSLDMFVSKLRKKLSLDPQLRISNVHGKGYKLEVIHSNS